MAQPLPFKNVLEKSLNLHVDTFDLTHNIHVVVSCYFDKKWIGEFRQIISTPKVNLSS